MAIIVDSRRLGGSIGVGGAARRGSRNYPAEPQARTDVARQGPELGPLPCNCNTLRRLRIPAQRRWELARYHPAS
jgi:hypothetical protein